MAPPQPPRLPPAFDALGQQPEFIYVKVPVGRRSTDPWHQREDEVDQALRAEGVGTVISWGESLGDLRPDGSRKPAYIRIDITAPALEPALAALQSLLPRLEMPPRTEIHYTREGRLCMDLLTAEGWQRGLLAPGPHGAGAP